MYWKKKVENYKKIYKKLFPDPPKKYALKNVRFN